VTRPSLFSRLASLRRRGSRRFCAIDFDSRQVRIVHAEQSGGGVRILKLATAAVPEGVDVANAASFGAFLGSTLTEMHLGGTSLLMNVPRGQAVLKPLILPPVATTGELASMVEFQAEKELSFKPGEAVVDFTLESHYGAESTVEDQAAGEHVLVAAVQRGLVDYYLQVAAAAGATLLRLGLRPYSNLRCVETYARQEVPGRVALIHITADETEIDICDAGALAFSRSAVVKIPPHAEGVAADEVVQAVVTEVARSLHSYLGVDRAHAIDTILVAGGTGLEHRIVEELGKRASVRTETVNPAYALGIEEAGAEPSAFISALGLAVGQGAEAGLPFDFLNPKRPPVLRDFRRVATITAVSALVVLLAGIFAVAGGKYYAANSRFGALRDEYNKLNEGNRKVAALAKRVQTIDGWVRGGRNWLEQWAYLSEVFPSCTEAYVTGLKTNPDGSVSFTVKAKSNEAINDLGKRLAGAGYDFRPGQISTGTDPYGYTYSTSVKVMVKPNMKVDLAGATAAPRPEDDVSAEKFGKPPAAVAAAGQPPAGKPGVAIAPAAAPAPGVETPYRAWRVRFEALLKERPPSAQVEARKEWVQKFEALQKEKPPPDPGAPPLPVYSGKRKP